jgi:ElaB/YqjD/DUF883 family membrane-anchored ribosome-binding protein
MLRPAPWQAEPKASFIPRVVPDKIYEAVPMVPPIKTGCPVFFKFSVMADGRDQRLGSRPYEKKLEDRKNAPTSANKTWRETVENAKMQTESYLHEHAWAALLLAVGVGALLGMLVRRK